MANDINRSIKIYIDSTEAGKSIEGLEAKIKTLEAQLNKLDSSDPKQAEQAAKLKSSLESSYRSLDKYKTGVEQTERVLKNLSGTTYKELLAVQQRIKNDLNNTARGTSEYNMKLEQLKRVSKEVTIAQGEMRTVVGAQGSMWSRASDFVNKYMGVIGSAIAAVTGVSLAFNKLREERNKLEESQADVKALTGLDDESINWLTQQAKELSTTAQEGGIRIRKSADEIMEAYMLVGSAKPELLGDKEALAEVTKQTMILAEASGMDLKDAVNATTLALNQYGMGADKAAEFVNTLAAGSKFGASAVESQTAAILKAGVAASSANVNFQQLVGVIETLGEKGIKDEIAGTGLKKFFLTLQTGADETNPKIVGLQTALENLSKKQLTATEIKKQFGEEGYNVAQVLISEADKVKYYTEAVTGTSVAMEQAGIKGQTAQAKLEQAKNKMTELGVELMEQLNPAIMSTVSHFTNWTKRVVELTEWISKHTSLVIILASEIAALTIAVKLYTIAHAVQNKTLLENIKLTNAYVAAESIANSMRYLAAAAVALLSGNIGRARAAIRALNTAMIVNPWVAVATAIAAVTTAIYYFVTRTNDAKDAVKEFNKENIKEHTTLTNLYNALMKTSQGTKERSDLIKEFNEKYGKYLNNLLSENATLNQITAAYNQVTAAMQRNIAQKILNQKQDKILNDSLEDQQNELQDVRKLFEEDLPESQVSLALTDVVSKTQLLNDKGYDLKTTWASVFQYLQSQYYGGKLSQVPQHLANQLKDYVKEVYDASRKIAKVKQSLNPFLTDNSPKTYVEATVTAKAPTSVSLSPSVSSGRDKTKSAADLEKEEQEKRLKVVNDAIMKEKEALQQKYISGAIMYDDYNKKMEMLTLEQLEKQLTVYGVDSEKRKQIEQQIYDFKMKLMDKDYDAYIKDLEEKGERDRDAKSEKEAKFKQLSEDLKVYMKAMSDNMQKYSLDSMKKVDQYAVKYKDNIMDFAQSLGETLGSAITDSETSLADAMGDILLLCLDTLRQIVMMSIAQTTATTIAEGGPLIAASVAKAAIKIALINAAYYAVKGLIKKPTANSSTTDTTSSSSAKTGYRSATADIGYAVGGYTGAGGILEPAGIVHRNEYVVPAWEMAQPVAMNHVAALEAIRQQRSSQVRANGYANGGQVGGSASLASMSSEALITAIVKLSDKIDTMRAYVVLSDLEAKQSLRNKARSIGSK